MIEKNDRLVNLLLNQKTTTSLKYFTLNILHCTDFCTLIKFKVIFAIWYIGFNYFCGILLMQFILNCKVLVLKTYLK